MLTITNIDDCNFSIQGNLGTITGLRVLGKTEFVAEAHEPVYNELQGRVVIYNVNTGQQLVNRTPISEITLEGTVYTTALAFVVAFNNMMEECNATTTAEVTTTATPTTTAAPTTTATPTTTGA